MWLAYYSRGALVETDVARSVCEYLVVHNRVIHALRYLRIEEDIPGP